MAPQGIEEEAAAAVLVLALLVVARAAEVASLVVVVGSSPLAHRIPCSLACCMHTGCPFSPKQRSMKNNALGTRLALLVMLMASQSLVVTADGCEQSWRPQAA